MTALKELREELGRSQIRLAVASDVHPSRLSYLESGYFPMTRKEADKLIKGYAKLKFNCEEKINEIFENQVKEAHHG